MISVLCSENQKIFLTPCYTRGNSTGHPEGEGQGCKNLGTARTSPPRAEVDGGN